MLSNKGSCPFTADTEQEQQSLIVCLSKCFIKFPTNILASFYRDTF